MKIFLYNFLGYLYSIGVGNMYCICKCLLYSYCWKCVLLKNKRVELYL